MTRKVPIPSAVAEAAAARHERFRSPSEYQVVSTIKRGDLRFATATRVSELVVVIELTTFGEKDFANVALVHPYVEFATSADAIIGPEATGLTYDIVVQSDLRGMVWMNQLSDVRIAQLDAEALDAANAALIDGASEGGPRVGIPLAGPGDARWLFKADQGRTIQSLAASATTWILNYEHVPVNRMSRGQIDEELRRG